MNQIVFQNCSHKDFPKIMPILEAYSDIFDFQEKRFILQQANKALDEDPNAGTLFMALHDGVVIGFFGGRRNVTNPLRLDLFCLIIKRGYHGQGVGTQLFNHGRQTVQQLGYQQIHVRLKGTYPAYTKEFYRKLGFKVAFDEDFTGASDEDTAMLLNLK